MSLRRLGIVSLCALVVCVLQVLVLGQTRPITRPTSQPSSGPAASQPANVAPIQIYADVATNQLRFMWEYNQWPADAMGVKLAVQKADGSWEMLSAATIEPGVTTQKDLALVENDPSKLANLTTMRDGLIKSKKLKELPPDDARKLFATGGLRTLKAMRAEAFREYQRAQLMGMGTSIAKPADVGQATYGLFWVKADGAIGAKPDAVCQPIVFAFQDPRLQAVDVTIYVQKTKAYLEWKLPESFAKEQGIYSFHVFRAEGAGGNFTKLLTPNGVASSQVTDGLKVWELADQMLEAGKDYRYAIAAVNLFGSEFSSRVEISTTESTHPLERMKKQPSGGAATRGAATQSAIAPKRPVDRNLPAMPRDVKAELVQKNGKFYAKVTWKAGVPTAKKVAGYRIWMDAIKPGEIAKQLSIPPVKGTEYLLELPLDADRVVKIGVSAVGDIGQETEYATTELFTPAKNMALFKNLKAEWDEQTQKCHVTWEYPSLPYLTGFELYMGKTKLAGTDVLKPDAREYEFDVKDDDLQLIRLVVISKYGQTRDDDVNVVRKKIEKHTIDMLKDLKSEWIEKDGKKAIRLTWSNPVHLEYSTIRIEADENVAGVQVKATHYEIVSPTEIVYTVSDLKRPHRIVIIVEAITEKNAVGYGGADIDVDPINGVSQPNITRAVVKTSESDPDLGFVECDWEVASTKNIVGFRVSVGGKLLADEKTLGPDARHFLSQNKVNKRIGAVEVQTIGPDGVVSKISGKLLTKE